MQEACVIDLCVGVNSFFVESCESRGGGHAIKAVAVIEKTKSHIGSQKSATY
jgi:hypothetical protein